MQALGPKDQPFETSDGLLAFSLYLAGVPFSDPTTPCFNEYDVPLLDSLGFGGKGLLPDQAAIAAVKANRPGRRKYLFQQSEELPALLIAFQDQENKLDSETEIEARDEILNLIKRIDVDTGAGNLLAAEERQQNVVRLGCTILKTRTQFMDMWKMLPPWIAFDSNQPSREVKHRDGSRTVKYKGFIKVSANASEKTKKRLGLM